MLNLLRKVLRVVVLSLCTVPVLGILGGAEVFAQVDTAWVRRYNGPSDSVDEATAIAVDHSGNVYVTGTTRGSGTNADYATVKYYPNGDTAWVRRYNGPGNHQDGSNAMTADDSGNVYVTGSITVTPFVDFDYATIKYYPNGDTAWVRTYDGPGKGKDYGFAIAIDSSGKVYVTGNSLGNSGLTHDYATVKYYPNGDTVWVRRYNGPSDSTDRARAIAVDHSGNVYVTGESGGAGTLEDYATIKYYPDGDTAWVRRYNGPSDSSDMSSTVAVDHSGNVYVTGASRGSGTNDDYATIKYYPNGDTAWVRRYNGPGNGVDNAYDIAVDGSGNVYVTGRSYGSGTSDDYATIKYDLNGDTVWVRRYNGPGNYDDWSNAMATDDSGNVYVTGYSWGSETGFDFATIKYYPNGSTAWTMRYNGPGNLGEIASAITVDDSGSAYVTGSSYDVGTDYDYATIKYVQSSTDVGDETERAERPTEFALSQNYPNPFNPSTTIHYTVHRPQSTVHSPIHTTLKIYNMLGEKVRTLVDEPKRVGNYTVQWDGKNDKGEQLASGVYFYQLKVGDNISTNKMVLLK